MFLRHMGFPSTVYPSHKDFLFHMTYHKLKLPLNSFSELQKQSLFLTTASLWLVAELNWS